MTCMRRMRRDIYVGIETRRSHMLVDLPAAEVSANEEDGGNSMRHDEKNPICWIDDDAHHFSPCNNCKGELWATPECRPAQCPVCKEHGHVSSYIRVIRRDEN